ncbi:flagellar protein FlaG [Alkalibacterium subtropicum]|uniref:Flagellar protein FlaG n=1 Tax=Alkalibacterium subtropicum TaxID=753702 RepID=A0A1I1IUH9_9LACT|nr:flagellar protein FlaG [Alkalibacterium subtropicum]SFC39886.1 flagellar protein FlaG [Alkalibacterium subtropicum]
MNQRVTSVDAIRTIDRVLLSNKNTVFFSEDGEVEPVKVIEPIETLSDRLEHDMTKEQLEKRAVEATTAMQRVNTHLAFKVHEGTGRTLVQLIEKETNEVIREIPPEKMLDVIAGIWKWSGITLDRME